MDLLVDFTGPDGKKYEFVFPDFNPDKSQSTNLWRMTTKGQRDMNWLTIIGLIIQFIIGRIQPAAASYATQRGKSETAQVREIAKAMVAAEPQLNFECLMKVLPSFLEKMAALVKEKGFYDYAGMVEIVLASLVDLLRCQFGSASASASPTLDNEIMQKLLSCGIKWGFHYFTTKDIAGAISGFFGCVLTGTGGGSNPPNPPVDPPVDPPGGGGGIDPERPPTFRAVGRCSS